MRLPKIRYGDFRSDLFSRYVRIFIWKFVKILRALLRYEPTHFLLTAEVSVGNRCGKVGELVKLFWGGLSEEDKWWKKTGESLNYFTLFWGTSLKQAHFSKVKFSIVLIFVWLRLNWKIVGSVKWETYVCQIGPKIWPKFTAKGFTRYHIHKA